RQAQAQYDQASPALKAQLQAYADGVNAFLKQRHGALPPEFILLNYQPEPWTPVDSLIWGRLMAQQLSQNGGDELLNGKLKAALPDDLYRLLTRRNSGSSAIDAPANTDAASNNWVVAGARTASGKPLLANDPHLGLMAPSTWYLVRLETPTRTLIGATAPGLPMLIIGSNGHVAWGFTTTMSDVQDIFDEKLDPQDPGRYLTPTGVQRFATRHEVIKVKGWPDDDFIARATRHGPVISDTRLIPAPPGHVLALAWTSELPDDRTAEALLEMNQATSAAEFRAALRDFAAPQQNVVFADVAGAIGFVAPGRVPLRRTLYDQSRLPVPGWTDAAEWIGMIPFDDLPQQSDPGAGWIATANNDVSGFAKAGFYGAEWDIGYRYRRIAERLSPVAKMTLDDSVDLQRDIVSLGVLQALKVWLPKVAGHPDVTAALQAWDGQMRRDQAEPLIATAWVDHLAHRLLARRLGSLYINWWFWQTDILMQLTADDRWCDDPATAKRETCRDQLSASLDDTMIDLAKSYGSDWTAWRWGNAHRVTFENPLWRNIPLVSTLLR
ncbi:MAG TPA: penicillin acylase family protein, partial [Dongiaceae bacterium]